MILFSSASDYETKINDLRIAVSSFFLYNLLMTYNSFANELNWDFPLVGRDYADLIGIQLPEPKFTPKLNLVSGSMNFLFSLCIFIPVLVPTPEFRNYLLPGIIWNVYAVTAHCNNILELTYDLFVLSGNASVVCSFFLTGSFTLSLHIMLLCETILFYDYLNYVPKDIADLTVLEIEKHFCDTSEIWDDARNEEWPSTEGGEGDAF